MAVITGTAASQRHEGTPQDDIINGLGGNDTLAGGDGNDTYVFEGAFGRDSIIDTSGTDVVQFGAGLLPSQFRLVRNSTNNDLVIQQIASDNAVTLENYFGSTGNRGAVETILFTATQTIWNLVGGAAFLNPGFVGTAAAERVIGTPGADRIEGLGGNDTLTGGDGNDIYVFSGAFGRDSITDSSGVDRAIIGFDWTDAAFQIVRPTTNNDLVIQTANGANALVFENYFANAQRVETIYFQATGATWDLSTGNVVRSPGLFSFDAYTSAYADIRLAGIDPYAHYLTAGFREGRDPSAGFDTKFYLVRNPDVAAAGVNPLLHYLVAGQAEGRPINPAIGNTLRQGFDAEYYLLANPDVGRAGIDAFAHWSNAGWREGRDPNYLFDTSFYLAQNTDVARAGIDPLLHYSTSGWREGRDPSAGFDTSAYLTANPDIARAGINPLEHYLLFGVYESRPLG